MSRLIILAIFFGGCTIYVPYQPTAPQARFQYQAPQPAPQKMAYGQLQPVVVVEQQPVAYHNRPAYQHRSYHQTYRPRHRHYHSTPRRTHVRPVRHVRPAPRPHRARPAPTHRVVRRNAPPPRPTKVYRAPARRARPVRRVVRPVPVRVKARPANRRRR